MKKFNVLQEDPERQYLNFRNKINKQKEYSTSETEIFKQNQVNSGAEELNKWDEECFPKQAEQADHMEVRISELKGRSREMTQVERDDSRVERTKIF